MGSGGRDSLGQTLRCAVRGRREVTILGRGDRVVHHARHVERPPRQRAPRQRSRVSPVCVGMKSVQQSVCSCVESSYVPIAACLSDDLEFVRADERTQDRQRGRVVYRRDVVERLRRDLAEALACHERTWHALDRCEALCHTQHEPAVEQYAKIRRRRRARSHAGDRRRAPYRCGRDPPYHSIALPISVTRRSERSLVCGRPEKWTPTTTAPRLIKRHVATGESMPAESSEINGAGGPDRQPPYPGKSSAEEVHLTLNDLDAALDVGIGEVDGEIRVDRRCADRSRGSCRATGYGMIGVRAARAHSECAARPGTSRTASSAAAFMSCSGVPGGHIRQAAA
jgi:hypothetical protein